MIDSEASKLCSIGIELDIYCHKIANLDSFSLKLSKDLDQESQKLLQWRTGLCDDNLQTVCNHHEKMFLTCFESSQMKCCDPFQRHKTAVRMALRPISTDLATKCRDTGISVKPGQKLCTACRKKVTAEPISDHDEDQDFVSPVEERLLLDESLTTLGCSPLKVKGVKDRVAYGKRKIRAVQESAADKVSKVLNIPCDAALLNPIVISKNECTKCNDLSKLVEELKEKCQISSRKEKVKLLTLVPSSWSIDRVAAEFNVSNYLVKKSRELRRSSGILAAPHTSRSLSN